MEADVDRTVRARITGRVQGVCYRAWARAEAEAIGVTGWVRNVGYDTVEALAEGTGEQIERFLQMVKRGPLGARVDESREEWEPVTGEFGAFRVKASM